MPFTPFADQFDPSAPSGHRMPILYLRSHADRWAFPAGAEEAEINGYLFWLHTMRIGQEFRDRERALRPPLFFRLRVFARRLHFLWQAVNGTLPPDVLADLTEREQEQAHGNG